MRNYVFSCFPALPWGPPALQQRRAALVAARKLRVAAEEEARLREVHPVYLLY
jgi:hypothetical protein